MAVPRQRVNSLAFSVISQITGVTTATETGHSLVSASSWFASKLALILDIILGVHIWMSGCQGDVLKTNFVSVEKCIATAEGKE